MTRNIRPDMDYLEAVSAYYAPPMATVASSQSEQVSDADIPNRYWLAGIAVLIEDAGLPGEQYVHDNADSLLQLRDKYTAAEIADAAITKAPPA